MTDWISAVANVVMAIAAVAALRRSPPRRKGRHEE